MADASTRLGTEGQGLPGPGKLAQQSSLEESIEAQERGAVCKRPILPNFWNRAMLLYINGCVCANNKLNRESQRKSEIYGLIYNHSK